MHVHKKTTIRRTARYAACVTHGTTCHIAEVSSKREKKVNGALIRSACGTVQLWWNCVRRARTQSSSSLLTSSIAAWGFWARASSALWTPNLCIFEMHHTTTRHWKLCDSAAFWRPFQPVHCRGPAGMKVRALALLQGIFFLNIAICMILFQARPLHSFI